MSTRESICHFMHHHSTSSDTSVSQAWYNFLCGHCETKVTGLVVAAYPEVNGPVRWLFCPNCRNGSIITNAGMTLPHSSFGPTVQGLPNDIQNAYDEARACFSIKAYTSCELMCRKILMHVGVEKGYPEGKPFVEYIDHIQGQGYITPVMKDWVDLIRKHGNTSTHKLQPTDALRAESTLMFTAELLKLIYEMEHIGKKYTPQSP